MGSNKKRLCLFAGFDAQGEIADYVIYYLKALSKLADVYYWGDFEATDRELAKLEHICKNAFCQKHGKYDFGSWQELIQKIGRKEIEEYDELILANDSCYGPFYNLANLFSKMNSKPCDFWGLSSAYNSHIHLQSYFIVLKKSVIKSDVFYDFFEQVKPEANYDDVCLNYEDRFTYILNKSGFRSSSFIAYNDLDNHPYQDAIAAIKKRHFPFLKVKFFLGGICNQGSVTNWRKLISENTSYPVELIEKDLVRRGYSLAEIDLAILKKCSQVPNFKYKKFSLKRYIRKAARIVFKKTSRRDGVLSLISRKTCHQGENIQLEGCDAAIIKNFSLDLPLTRESDTIIIGNLSSYKLSSLGINKSQTVFLNSRSRESKGQNFWSDNLCDFSFINERKQPVYFDFILIQPLELGLANSEIELFIANLKRQMVFESVLVMMVSDDKKERYEQILQSQGLCSAIFERGIVARVNPFQVYYDKIESIKGYKPLIYKIK